MKKLILVIVVIGVGIFAWNFYKSKSNNDGDDTKQAPMLLKKHSDTFNNAVELAMKSYFDMSAAFVDADTAGVKTNARKFIQLIDSVNMDELKKDTANIYDVAMDYYKSIKLNAESILVQSNITEMRKDFWNVSENLYPYFKLINYEGENMYWQNCPMAFGDDKGANWISSTKEIVNPYLGKNHPVYKGSMLKCGLVKDTIKTQ